ncbi:hypothetical protein DC498_05865 [Terrimonas sp.]|uniref:3-keto-disaccharide hydrolase n=1 Tax=Terrimonas sp. TaxID=1914338 RepID=UPI000D506C78|nr:DUF1080 domain-containing protein [Terrimonas sp.]PVD53396.1 hypothetical protein DC498_05865 [Terrimonas sp.]
MKNNIRLFLIAAICIINVNLASAQKWINLFNGKDLAGWHILPGGNWQVEKGVIVGTSTADEKKHGMLLTDSIFGDFEVEISYKAVKGNSGLYFRAEKVQDDVGVYGFQAEIDPEKDAGGLYETGGRTWVVKPTPEQVKTWYKSNQWNTMKVRAVGRDITVWVNGKETAKLTNDPGRTAGRIGLQLHGGMDMEIYFRQVRIRSLE